MIHLLDFFTLPIPQFFFTSFNVWRIFFLFVADLRIHGFIAFGAQLMSVYAVNTVLRLHHEVLLGLAAQYQKGDSRPVALFGPAFLAALPARYLLIRQDFRHLDLPGSHLDFDIF